MLCHLIPSSSSTTQGQQCPAFLQAAYVVDHLHLSSDLSKRFRNRARRPTLSLSRCQITQQRLRLLRLQQRKMYRLRKCLLSQLLAIALRAGAPLRFHGDSALLNWVLGFLLPRNRRVQSLSCLHITSSLRLSIRLLFAMFAQVSASSKRCVYNATDVP